MKRRLRDPNRWRPADPSTGPATAALTLAWLMGSAAWTLWPVIASASAPSRDQIIAEAPFVVAAQLAGLLLILATLSKRQSRQWPVVGTVAVLIAFNVAIRALFAPGVAGAEVVHAVSLLAGVGLGLPAGVVVGAGSAIGSTMLVATPSDALATQAFTWAAIGAAGALLSKVGLVWAWLVSIPLAIGVGVLAGFLLNSAGWSLAGGTPESQFVLGLPPAPAAERLWHYTAQSSIALDLTRGLTTALIVALIGVPLLRRLRGPSMQMTVGVTDLFGPRRLGSGRVDLVARQARRTEIEAGQRQIWAPAEPAATRSTTSQETA